MQWTEFDARLPKWEQSPSVVAGGRDGAGCDLHNWASYRGGGRTLPLRDKDGRIIDRIKVPSARYVRAIDPDGNLIPLVVCTNRVDIKDPAALRIIQSKRRDGWLMLDEPDHTRSFGTTLEDWHAYCAKEAATRQSAHNTAAAAFAQKFRTEKEALKDANSETLIELFKSLLLERKPEPAADAAPVVKRGRPALGEAVNG